MAEYSLLDMYDFAQELTENDSNIIQDMQYVKTHIRVAAESGQVRVWLVEDSSIENVFDVNQFTPEQFDKEVTEFVRDAQPV